jgi:spermidine synthase
MHSLKTTTTQWFSEVNKQWPGQAMSIEVEKILWDKKSEYQHVVVFQSKAFGNVLVIDDVIQFTERDESAYQEMITHLPMFSHPNPENVLIVGGGDGGVIREVVKHSTVKHITICEIDQMVIDCGKKFFPSVAKAWVDKRLTVVCNDAAVFMDSKEAEGKFDVIVCDSSDPVGPAQALFESKFYRSMFKALRPGGRIATQAESVWNNRELIAGLIKKTSPIFASVDYATTQIPTYPCGQIGFLMCCKAGGTVSDQCRVPVRSAGSMDLEYYSTELHSAAFVLPAFMTKIIQAAKADAAKEAAAAKPAAAAEVKPAEPAAKA